MLRHRQLICSVGLDRGNYQAGTELIVDKVSIHFANFVYEPRREVSDLDSAFFKLPPTTAPNVSVRIEYPDNDLANSAIN